MTRVAFNTLGCKVNQYETESMMAQFEANGYEICAFSEKADIYIVNTCTVTNMADKKSRQMLSKAKKMNPGALVVAVGCYVQAAQDALEQVEYVDLLVGNTDKGTIVEVVEHYLEDHQIPEVKDLTRYRTYDDLWPTQESGNHRVHIKIQDGCDQFCSYCIIPYARGRIRSRSAANILKEVTELVAKGYKEVVLTGIHLASYGVQFENYLLIDLLEDLDRIEGLERVRLGSLEPTIVDETLVHRMKALPSLCDHFHLSMQSGSDRVLKAMNRKYTTDDYRTAVCHLRRGFPDCAITTDLIVGFPGETDEMFGETLDFLKKVGFSDVHVFKYSVRNGTQAAKMKDQIDGSLKQSRSQEAMKVAAQLHHDFTGQYIGRSIKVLLEEKVTLHQKEWYVGHTSNYMKVYVQENGQLSSGQVIRVRTEGRLSDGLKGILMFP